MRYLALAATALLAAPAAFAQDAAEGETLFKRCASCHMIADGDTVINGRGKTGPNLFGVVGRQAGTAEGYSYSDSLVAAGEAGLVWDEASFAEFTMDPRKYLQSYLDDAGAKSKMTFRLRDGAADLWAYLVTVSPPATN